MVVNAIFSSIICLAIFEATTFTLSSLQTFAFTF
jgi:hypothetical protein